MTQTPSRPDRTREPESRPLLPTAVIVGIVLLMNMIFGVSYVISWLDASRPVGAQLHIVVGAVNGTAFGLSRIRVRRLPYRLVRNDRGDDLEESEA